MGIYQIIWIILTALSVGCTLADHGKPRTGKNNVWTTLIAAAIQLGLLYGGGFFG